MFMRLLFLFKYQRFLLAIFAKIWVASYKIWSIANSWCPYKVHIKWINWWIEGFYWNHKLLECYSEMPDDNGHLINLQHAEISEYD